MCKVEIKCVLVQINVCGGQTMTPVQVEPFRDSCRACKLLFCNFQDDCYKGLEETLQLGSDSC